MPSVGFDPETGRLTLDGEVLERNDPRMWGAVGRNVLDVSTGDPGAFGQGDYDPRYYEAYTVAGSEGDGGQTRYRLRPDVAERLGGRTQLSQSGVGGFAEAQDPSQVAWDDEFGLITNTSNIREPDPGTFFDQYGPWLMMALAGGAVAGGQMGLMGSATEGGGLMGLGAAEGGLGAAEAGAEGFLGLGGAGGSGLAGGVPGYGAGAFPMIGDAGNLAWTDIAAANPELAGIPSLGNGLSASQILRGANSIRQLLGGQQGQQGRLGGVPAAMMAQAPQIGQHRPNTDLYGLQASGLGPWSPFTKEDPKKKAIEALLAQQLPNWG